ncbi:MAG: hypothetical protein NTX16_06210 [Actinobacteria bacterium]|nr:hypothetical protein [Actinomycetota bacterium]
MVSRRVSVLATAVVLALILCSGVPATAWAQGVTVTTFAGTAGFPGSADGIGAAAGFRMPGGVACDAAGNIYVADTENNAVRKITPAGVVSTFAGTAADLSLPGGVACDKDGNVYVADTWNQVIRKITPGGLVKILAGAIGEQDHIDGSGAEARFSNPGGVACDKDGNVYVADTDNNSVRKITSAGVVSTLAGADAGFDSPAGLACDTVGNVYVVDTFNSLIRKIKPTGEVSTLAGPAVGLSYPAGVVVDSAGNVYVADTDNYVIRMITASGDVSTLAGVVGEAGVADGTGAAARFDSPRGVACDGSGNVYVADTSNSTIRRASVDALPPVTTATPPLASSATTGWRNTAQTVTLTATDAGSGVAATSYSIDGGPTLTYTVPFTVSAPGSHAVTYFSTDNGGNVEAPQTGYVNIDAASPATEAQPAGVRTGRTVTLKFRIADAGVSCGAATVKLQIRKGSRVVKTISVGSKATNAALTYRYRTTLKKGAYTWRVLATDAAGNTALEMHAAKLTVKQALGASR